VPIWQQSIGSSFQLCQVPCANWKTPFWCAHLYSFAVLQVEELAKAKLEKPKRLGHLAARYWREIDAGTLVFGRPQAEVDQLRRLTREDLDAFFRVQRPVRLPPVCLSVRLSVPFACPSAVRASFGMRLALEALLTPLGLTMQWT
jgi:hypothetical protein